MVEMNVTVIGEGDWVIFTMPEPEEAFEVVGTG